MRLKQRMPAANSRIDPGNYTKDLTASPSCRFAQHILKIIAKAVLARHRAESSEDRQIESSVVSFMDLT